MDLESLDTQKYISLIDVIKILKKKVVFILLVAILCTGMMTVIVMLLSRPTYEAYTTAVIVKDYDSIVKNSQYTQSDIELYQKIVNTYVQIAQSNIVIEKTADELKTYSPVQLRRMISAAPSGETQIIKLKAVSNNRDDVANIANVYCKNFMEQSMSILPVGKIEVLDSARTPNVLISNNALMNIVVGFLFGLFLSVAIVLFRFYLESQKIKSEKQIKEILNIPVLVTIE
ncbi:MAG: capsular polysaccharide biosynthesis protein [Clostridiales bacterium]|nr:capsular polysaccharide biosynthesis protein [Clostridiales bacterium]